MAIKPVKQTPPQSRSTLQLHLDWFEHILKTEAKSDPSGFIQDNALLQFFTRLLDYCDPSMPFKHADGPISTNSAATATPTIAAVRGTINAFWHYAPYVGRLSETGDRIASRSAPDEGSVKYSEMVNSARMEIHKFVGASPTDTIIYTLNTSDAVGKVALMCDFTKDDIVLVPRMEHTSNFLPWLLRSGATRIEIEQDMDGSIQIEDLAKKLKKYGSSVRLVAFSAASNITGIRPNVKEIVDICHQHNSLVAIDCAQHAAHFPMNKKEWGADFVYFSGHKLGAPNGPGVLVVPSKWLEERAPLIPGGGTISDLVLGEDGSIAPVWAPEEAKHQPGTWPTIGIIQLGEVIKAIHSLGWDYIVEKEHYLLRLAFHNFTSLPGFRPLPVPASHYEKRYLTPVISFSFDGYTPDELSDCLAAYNIQHRGGSNDPICNHDYIRNKLGLTGIVRLSFNYHNTEEDILFIENALKELRLRRPIPIQDHELLTAIIEMDTGKLEELYRERGEDEDVERLAERNLTFAEKRLNESLALREIHCRLRDNLNVDELKQLALLAKARTSSRKHDLSKEYVWFSSVADIADHFVLERIG